MSTSVRREPLCHEPPSDPKNKNVYTVCGSGVTKGGKGPQFKTN